VEKLSPALHVLHSVKHTFVGDTSRASGSVFAVSVKLFELDFAKGLAVPSGPNSVCSDEETYQLIPIPVPLGGVVTVSSQELIFHKYRFPIL